jgi:hypothetical protein
MKKKLLLKHEQLVGKHVLIVPSRHDESTKFLNGLFAMVVGVHPIANSWLKLRLDANGTTPQLEWTLPADRLVVTGTAASLDNLAQFAPSSKTFQ